MFAFQRNAGFFVDKITYVLFNTPSSGISEQFGLIDGIFPKGILINGTIFRTRQERTGNPTTEQVHEKLFKRCLSVLAEWRWSLRNQFSDDDGFIACIFVILFCIRIMQHMGIAVEQKVKYAFVQYVFNLNKDSIFCKKMIHKFIHLV